MFYHLHSTVYVYVYVYVYIFGSEIPFDVGKWSFNKSGCFSLPKMLQVLYVILWGQCRYLSHLMWPFRISKTSCCHWIIYWSSWGVVNFQRVWSPYYHCYYTWHLQVFFLNVKINYHICIQIDSQKWKENIWQCDSHQ